MMTTKLEKAFHVAGSLPAEDQDAIAEAVMKAVHLDPREQEEWRRLVENEESLSLLGRMAQEVEANIVEGRTLDFDPSGK